MALDFDERLLRDNEYFEIQVAGQPRSVTGFLIAVHEGGHALEAVRQGVEIEVVRLGRHNDEDYNENAASITFTEAGVRRLNADLNLNVRVSCAGPAAEVLVARGQREATIEAYLDGSCMFGGWPGDMTLCYETHICKTGVRESDPDRVKSILLQAVEDAILGFSADDVRAVEEFADLLLSREPQTMSGEEVKAFFRGRATADES